MRVIYADPGLRDNLGHHANSCRAIVRELERRGINVVVLAFAGVIPELQEELHAIPLFRAYTYWQTDGDPISGWLNCFDCLDARHGRGSRAVAGHHAGRHRLSQLRPAGAVHGAGQVVERPADGQRPHVVMEFGTDPGVDVAFGADGNPEKSR